MCDKTMIKIRSNDLNYNFLIQLFPCTGLRKKNSKSLFGLGIWAIEIYDCSQIAKRLYLMHMPLWLILFFLICFSIFEKRSLQICLKERKNIDIAGNWWWEINCKKVPVVLVSKAVSFSRLTFFALSHWSSVIWF